MTTGQLEIDFVETGSGDPILFVPGSFSTPAAWQGVQADLAGKYRCCSTSLCGYGKTHEPRDPDAPDMAHQVAVIKEAADRIGEPVHLVGHSFGATAALAAVLDGSVRLRSLTTFEANPFMLLPYLGHSALFEAALRLSQEFEQAYLAGDQDAARLVIDYWGGAGSFQKMPDPVKEYCRKTTFNNVLDWRSCRTFRMAPAAISKLDIPVLLVRGQLASPAMAGITRALETYLPMARTAIVDGAGHFLITTHAWQCARLLDGFLDDIGPSRPERSDRVTSQAQARASATD